MADNPPNDTPPEVSIDLTTSSGQLTPFNVDLTKPNEPRSINEYTPPPKPFDPEQHKAQSATSVAKAIVGTFIGTIVGVFLIALVVLLISRSVDEAQKYAAVLVSILVALGNFLTAVFAPLLAFVLGYYFGEKSGGSK